MKLSISLPDDLVAKMDEVADANFLTRSGFIAMCCTAYINQMYAVEAVANMSKVLEQMASKGVSDEAMSELEKLQYTAQLLLKNK